jgi:hypothetical protein
MLTDVPWLLVQAGLAILCLRVLRRTVLPGVGLMQHASLALDVWLPLAIVLPMALPVWQVAGAGTWGLGSTASGGAGRGAVNVAIAGPIVCGWLAMGASVAARPQTPRPSAFSPHLAGMVWSGVGLVVLLLAAANRMAGWIGNSAFAMLAVLIWMGSHDPEPGRVRVRRAPPDLEGRVGSGVLVVLLGAAGQGLAAGAVGEGGAAVARVTAVAFAAAAATSAALAGRDAAIRVGGWSAAFGPLLALGMLAFGTLVPAAVDVWHGGLPSRFRVVAGGFAAMAPEAMGLVLLGPASLLAARLRRSSPLVAAAVIVLIAGGAALRLAWAG